MEAFVLDASVALSWCFPNDPLKIRLITGPSFNGLKRENVVVPEIWPFEIANGIFVAHNIRKRMSQAEISEYLGLLKAMPIGVAPGNWLRNVSLESLARKHNLAAYGVAYVDLARREKLPLALPIVH